jgi:hypothetical protein
VNASVSVRSGSAWQNGTAYTPDLTPWPTVLVVDEVEPATPSSNTTWNNIGDDRNLYNNLSLGGGYGELLLFSAALPTAARQTLETNEMDYFSIGTLPLTWLSFTAQLQGSAALLRWQTAVEENSKDFTVQCSRNGLPWTNLATLPAAGNSDSTRTYTYLDLAPANGNNDYRIMETDLDGNTHYSEIAVIGINEALPAFSVVANPPAGGRLQVIINSPITLSLYSTDGKLLWRQSCQPGTQDIDVSHYAAGIYLLTGNQSTEKILVQ